MTLTTLSRSACFALLAATAVGAHAAAIHDAGLFTTPLPANDDGSTGLVNLGFSVDFFGTTASQVYVNNNGNITFQSPLSTFTPFGLQTNPFPIIAPFFADVDTRGGPPGQVVTYGASTLGGRNVFGVDWINVGYFGSHVDKLNSFQLILTDRSDIAAGDFDIQFNYDTIKWETGDASGGSGGLGGTSAVVGYTAGDQTNFSEAAGSRVNGAFLDGGPDALISHSLNSTIAGQYNFEVRAGQVIVPGVPEPQTYALMLAGLGVLGWVALRRRAKGG
jgi:hypothetical protein